MNIRSAIWGILAAAGALGCALLAAMRPALAGALISPPRAQRASAVTSHRSPSDVALLPGGEAAAAPRWAVTANHTAGTASLVDLTACRVVAEVRAGERPDSVAVAPSGKVAAVTNTWSGTLSLLAVDNGRSKRLRKTADVAVGPEPRGVAISNDGRTAYVALTTADVVAVVDLGSRSVRKRIPVGQRPWHLGLSPDGQWLVVGNSRSHNSSLIATGTLEVVRTIYTPGHNTRQVAFSPDGGRAYIAHVLQPRFFPVTPNNIDIGWVLASRVSRVTVGPGKEPFETLALDPRGKAVGDPHGLAVSPDGGWLAISASGTHELLLFRLPLPFTEFASRSDFIEPELLRNDDRFRRVPLGGRPMGIRFSPDSRSVYVANYLEDAVQVVDVASASLARTIDLGRPATVSPARRGEAIFYDAARSFNQWFSCHSCHVDGHTNGLIADTLNDGVYGNGGKKTPSLRGVTETAPWTWHGWQQSLPAAMEHSLRTTMHGPPPSPQDCEDLVAFLATLKDPPHPLHMVKDKGRSARAKAGEKLFREVAGCASCHSGARLAGPGVFDVGLGSDRDRYQGHNPPALVGLYDRAPYLHDGRAKTLRDVLTKHHVPEKLTAPRALTPEDLDALIAYLNSL